MRIDRLIKIVLAILMLICLADMQYGYYEFVRYIALIGFSLLAYIAYQQKREAEIIVFIALAILFQPLFKIALGRELWNVVDVIVAIGLIVSLFLKSKKNE